MSSTAASSPRNPDQMMTGTLGQSSCASLRAAAPEKPGSWKSDRIRCGRKAASCSKNDSLVSTTTAVNPTPALVSRRCASSASQASSSRIRMRAVAAGWLACPAPAVACGSPPSASLGLCPSPMDVLPLIRYGLVQQQPEHPDRINALGEFGEVYWLS